MAGCSSSATAAAIAAGAALTPSLCVLDTCFFYLIGEQVVFLPYDLFSGCLSVDGWSSIFSDYYSFCGTPSYLFGFLSTASLPVCATCSPSPAGYVPLLGLFGVLLVFDTG